MKNKTTFMPQNKNSDCCLFYPIAPKLAAHGTIFQVVIKSIFFCACILFNILLWAQNSTFEATFIKPTLAEQDEFEAELNDFALYTLPLNNLYQAALQQKSTVWELQLSLGKQPAPTKWVMELKETPIFADETPLHYTDKKGQQKQQTIMLQTFEGKLKGQAQSRITLSLAPDFMAATVFDGKSTYTLQTILLLSDTLKAQKNTFNLPHKVLWYNHAALKNIPAATCANEPITTILPDSATYSPIRGHTNTANWVAAGRLQDPCRETVLLALAADYSLLQKIGSADLIGKYMAAVVHAGQTAYNDIGLNMQISEIYIETCPSCNEFGTNTNPFTLLNDFLAYAHSVNAPFENPYHVAQLWTARDMDGSTVGLAKLGGVCTNNRYCTIQDYSALFDRMRVLSAHELGHTFNAVHDASTSTYIMRPVVSEFCTQYSPLSLQAVTTCLELRTCFTNCQSCKGPAALVLQNYAGTTADLQWAAGSTNQYRLRWKASGSTVWANEVVTSDTIYHLTDLLPCSGYDFSVETICAPSTYSTPQTLSHKGVYLPSQTISYPSAGSVQVNWTNNTIVGAWPMQLRLRESNTGTWLQTIDITANTYTFTGLDICKNYELSLRASCAGGSTFGRDTLLTLRGARAYNVSGEGLSPTQARIVYYTNNSAASYTLRARLLGASAWLIEIPNAVSGNYYNLDGLTPCTSYEIQAQAYCGANGGNVTTSTFQTATMAIQSVEVSSCNPETAQYDLAVKIGHNHFGGNTLLLNVGGNSYPFAYDVAGPQVCTISGLPANNAQNLTLTAQDATFSTQCASSVYFDAPRPQCQCSTIWREDFDQCAFPAGWQNQPVGTDFRAYWQIGKTADNHSLNGTCMAFFDDDAFDRDGGEAVLLTTPTFDLSNYEAVQLQFLYNFHTIDGAFKVEVFDGVQWWQIAQLSTSNCGFWGCSYDEADIDISAYLNSQLKIRFRYEDGGGWDWFVAIDSLQLCGFAASDNCNAAFYYPSDTICSNAGVMWPILSGASLGGTFSASPAGLSIDALNGSIMPQASTAGNYTISRIVSESGCNATFQVRIESPCKVKISPLLFLQGPYNATTGQMNTLLRASSLLPPAQPYSVAPWNYSGTESYILGSWVPTNVVDWVLLELRHAANPSEIAGRKAVVLQSDGQLREVGALSASAGISFSGLNEGAYYLAVRPRNHLAVATNVPLWLNSHLQSFNFSTAASQALGGLQIGVSSNKFALVAGDINADGIINYNDFNRYFQQTNSLSGYFIGDCNMDKNVNTTDFGLWRSNAGKLTYNWLR